LSEATTKLSGNANTTSNRTKITVVVALAVIIIVAAFLASSLTSPKQASEDLTHVACVGDSITAFSGYPNDLQALLGNASAVGDFGVSGATVSAGSVLPYPYQNASTELLAFQPSTVVILLGTNDARADVYPYTGNFTADYKVLIDQIQQLASHPKIYLAIPPPVYENSINISSSHLAEDIIPKVRQVAAENGLPLIDTYTPLLNHPDYFVDGVHPNSQGAKAIAETVYRAIMASD
jgi:lysophospholipase L1-like esterase